MNNIKTPIELQLAEAAHYTPRTQLTWSKIALLYPIVQANGKNGCRVYYKDGSYDDVANSCMVPLKALARQHYTTVDNARALTRSCPWIKRQRMLNMIFSDVCTIVPLIVRESTADSDDRMGYLVKQYLYNTAPLPDGTLLKFSADHEGIRIVQKEATVRRQLMEVALLEQHYKALLAEQRRQRQEQETAGHTNQIGRYR